MQNSVLVVNVVQSLSHVQLFATPRTAACQASLSFTISWSLLKLTSIESVMPSNHLILCHPLLLPSIFPSIRVFSNELAVCIRQPKSWSFIISISPSSEYSGLISFRIDWFDLLAVQGTLTSLLQHHSSKASILQHSAFYKIQFKRCTLKGCAIVHLTISLLIQMYKHVYSFAIMASASLNNPIHMSSIGYILRRGIVFVVLLK